MNLKLGAFIIALLALYGICMAIRMFKRDKLTTRLLFMWLLLWFTIGFFALFPSLLDRLMHLANMGNRLFFVTVGAIVILYVILFYVTSNLSNANRKISKLVQQISILNYKLEDKTKNNRQREK